MLFGGGGCTHSVNTWIISALAAFLRNLSWQWGELLLTIYSIGDTLFLFYAVFHKSEIGTCISPIDFKTSWGHGVWGTSLTSQRVTSSFRGQEKCVSVQVPGGGGGGVVAASWLGVECPLQASQQALPSPQCAAGDLRRVEDDGVCEFQSPCIWRRISRFLLYKPRVWWAAVLSPWQEMDSVLQDGLRADS